MNTIQIPRPLMNPGKILRIKPESISQKRVLNSEALNVLYHGPWGTGKTHIGAGKALKIALKYPGIQIALVRKKRVDLKATLWQYFADKITPYSLIGNRNNSDLFIRLTNGSEIHGLGLDSATAVNKMASRQFGFIVIEEAREITESDFDEKIVRCLRQPEVNFHQALLLTNPNMPAHWIYDRWFTNPRSGYVKYKGTILFHILPRSYLERMDQLTGVFRERYRNGNWVAAEGLVYPFDPGKHIVKSFPIPKEWRRVVAVDFGFDHPFVCQFWAISPSDIWYMYREIYHSYRTVNTHSETINHFLNQDNISKIRIICDHDAEDRATLNEKKIRTVNARKDRRMGQQAVYDLFEQERIFFFQDALVERDERLYMEKKPWCSVMEFGGYVWTDKGKEDMIKEKDDGMDTMRYAIYTKLGRKKGRVAA